MGTCESREVTLAVAAKTLDKTLQVAAKNGSQGLSSPKNREDIKSDESIIKLKRNNYEPSDFVQYYDHIKRLLKEKKFKFSQPGDKFTFQTKLATYNGIDKETAKVWIHMYVDYMILVAWWKEHAKRTRIMYPPYAIQQVARLHTVYTKSYLRFCKIITENKRVIKLAPCKIMAKQETAVTCEALRNGYYSAMHFIWQKIYSNPNIGKNEEAKKQAEEVWEPFEQTLFKNEFSFNFLEPEKIKELTNKLADHQKEAELKSKDNAEIISVGKVFRDILGIGDLMKGSEQVKPTLMDQFKVAAEILDKEVVSKVEEVGFTSEFVNALAWENRISVETAKKWILEYKKFLFLSYIHRQKAVIVPSQIVDQVWHLHLQFVEAYQQDVYKKQEFHHNPWRASEEEAHKQRAWYRETLHLYSLHFGAPDAAIWPEDNVGFSEIATTKTYGLFFARRLVLQDEKFRNFMMQKYQKLQKSPTSVASTMQSSVVSSGLSPMEMSEIGLRLLE